MAISATAALLVLLAADGGRQAAAPVRLAEDYSRRRLVLAIEDGRNPTAAELNLLIGLARSSAADKAAIDTRMLAIRALGRLERRDSIPVLAGLLDDRAASAAAAFSLLLVVRAHAGTRDPEIERATDALLQQTQSPTVLAHLPYTRSEQVQLAETKLLVLGADRDQYGAVAASFEAVARKHRRLHALGDRSLDFLRRAVRRALPGITPLDDGTPRGALAALAAAGQADEEIVHTGLRDRSDQVRRTALEALYADGASVDPALRAELTRASLNDSSGMVRYEALRGWIRHETTSHGCGPIVGALSDRSLHIVLAALDALGERCLEDEAITERLVTEAATPPEVGEWQRGVHAFAALARRSRESAATAMPAFISHNVWQVRMYAARAAAAMKDVVSLERLAYDANDNVREATLVALRTLKGADSDGAFIAALGRSDYQLLRTAAKALENATSNKYLLDALVEAMERVTAEKKETSRDTRLALLEQIRAMGGREQLPMYERLLKDFDPRIAAAAAEACTAASGRQCAADPQPLPRPPPPSVAELAERVNAVLELDNGRRFVVILDRQRAPLACARFIRLLRAHYYDGLTFHRIVPNFVIQGGSPGANEYVGDGPFMRDELGGSHRRGTVGISTRGRHTGDAQIFVNLVDNLRLDLEYTVFARVHEDHMEIVDGIREGTRILRVNLVPAR
jgi:cyclophilin family peptidyl-prolyl cis-trans isomerase